jgi:hypothetical protein
MYRGIASQVGLLESYINVNMDLAGDFPRAQLAPHRTYLALSTFQN